MYKVVIIDDEPIIVEGLSRSIDWEAVHCYVAGTAYNGEEGLKLIRSEKPDMVFSDIRMPYMDGLSMIAAIKSEFPDIQITILTGYRDFDYAQKAIRLGVCRFLLKPSKMDEIMEALEAMTGKLNTNREKEPDEEGQAAEEEILDSTASSFVVNNAVAYIEEHYQEKLKLSDVADQVYVSQWHLSKLMNRYLGQNFSEILNGIRIDKAKELLKDPSLRIGDIADAVGFMDMAHFSRVFKKTVGISANEYRNHL
ncbi:MAG: response regulator [Lachnospiraceae bacterium]|nr:response regulator [Lachnospiraceae bacterium]